jgi:hypothetical protein
MLGRANRSMSSATRLLPAAGSTRTSRC